MPAREHQHVPGTARARETMRSVRAATSAGISPPGQPCRNSSSQGARRGCRRSCVPRSCRSSIQAGRDRLPRPAKASQFAAERGPLEPTRARPHCKTFSRPISHVRRIRARPRSERACRRQASAVKRGRDRMASPIRPTAATKNPDEISRRQATHPASQGAHHWSNGRTCCRAR